MLGAGHRWQPGEKLKLLFAGYNGTRNTGADVRVEEINDMLGDHYDPSGKRLCLSTDVYRGSSVASVGIAAHECGHALQHQQAPRRIVAHRQLCRRDVLHGVMLMLRPRRRACEHRRY